MIGRQWGKIKNLGGSLFQTAENEASSSIGRAYQSEASTSGRISQYAKLNLPKGRWEGHASQQHASKQRPAVHLPWPGQNWVSFWHGPAFHSHQDRHCLLYTTTPRKYFSAGLTIVPPKGKPSFCYFTAPNGLEAFNMSASCLESSSPSACSGEEGWQRVGLLKTFVSCSAKLNILSRARFEKTAA